MLRQGPIPRFAHSIIEYGAGAFLIAAPFLFDYDQGTAVSIVAGVALIFLAAISEAPLGLIPQIPAATHIAIDYLLALLFVAAPFIFGFSDETGPTVVFIAGGVAYLLMAVATRYLRDTETLGQQRRVRKLRKKSREEQRGPLEDPPEFDVPPRGEKR